MFDLNNISTISNLSIEEVRAYLPSVLHTVRDYTNRSYITPISIADTFVISANTIYSEIGFDEFEVGDIVELKLKNDSKLMSIIAISPDYKELTVSGNLTSGEKQGLLIKLSFPISDLVISQMLVFSKSPSAYGVVSETLDGYSYTKASEKLVGGYPMSIITQLSSLRKLPGSAEKEYWRAGYVV